MESFDVVGVSDPASIPSWMSNVSSPLGGESSDSSAGPDSHIDNAVIVRVVEVRRASEDEVAAAAVDRSRSGGVGSLRRDGCVT